MTARIVRRGIRGTTVPNLAARPVRPAVEVVPSSDGDLRGAACIGVDPDLFFPADEDEFTERRARQICAGCPVREMCLALALRRNEPYGIFGGLDPAERRVLARRQRRAAADQGGRAA